jgi:hypothetical protein
LNTESKIRRDGDAPKDWRDAIILLNQAGEIAAAELAVRLADDDEQGFVLYPLSDGLNLIVAAKHALQQYRYGPYSPLKS